MSHEPLGGVAVSFGPWDDAEHTCGCFFAPAWLKTEIPSYRLCLLEDSEIGNLNRRSGALRACICLHAQVRSNLCCLYLLQRISVQPARVSKRYFAITCNFRRIKQNKLVDHIRFQSGSV